MLGKGQKKSSLLCIFRFLWLLYLYIETRANTTINFTILNKTIKQFYSQIYFQTSFHQV